MVIRTLPNYRLTVIMAREAPRAVIFRQGPRLLVELILWHTDTDEFVRGQWFKGEIEAWKADLSPDGTKLIYTARRHKRVHWKDKETGYSWTAISKPPYLTAVAFWPGVFDGYFEGNDSVILNCWGDVSKAHLHRVPEGLKVNFSTDNLWHSHAYVYEKWESGSSPAYKFLPHVSGLYRLVMFVHSWESPEFSRVVDEAGESVVNTEGVSWGDWDQRGRLVLVKEGRLWIGEPVEGGFQMRELADFREDRFEPVVAPDWAKVW